jgi:hypothetical protein
MKYNTGGLMGLMAGIMEQKRAGLSDDKSKDESSWDSSSFQ